MLLIGENSRTVAKGLSRVPSLKRFLPPMCTGMPLREPMTISLISSTLRTCRPASNYAVSTSDSGHWGSARDSRWAMNNPVAVMDWAQRSVPETARVSKIILKTFYGT
jgi:hypothetical protein